MLLGSRLANNVGAPRTAGLLLTRAFRRTRLDPRTRLHYAYRLMQKRGPWPTWQFLEETPASDDLDTEASLIAFRGVICAIYRDEEAASSYLQKARHLLPESPWVWSEWSRVHEYLDRHDEAISAARQALSFRPWYRPAVQQLLHLLLLANKDDEARSVFLSANSALESGPIIQQWIVACSEREEYSAIPGFCQQARELMPHAEKETREWLAAREMDAFYALGDFDRAAVIADDLEAAKDLAAKLRTPGFQPRCTKIQVPFVRQADATCAPASLASVASHWHWDITHDEIAEAVCYGGTFPHTLRRWITERGWLAREFRVTWQSLQDLTDAGVPFLLATNEVGGGHMQVVEGYDETQGEILIRDPNFRHHRRVEADSFLSRYAAFGPRGFIVLPPDEAPRLEHIPLEAVAGYDRMYALSVALENHDRDAAAVEFYAMEAENAPDFLLLGARLSLAEYDANPLERLNCLEAMEVAGLRHPFLTQMRLEIARNFRAETNYLETLRAAADPLRNKDGWDTSFLLSLAIELSDDDRNFPEVRRLFFRYHALQPRDAGALSFWGKVLWIRQRQEEARQLLRFACTCADKVEQFASEYSTATQLMGREDESLDLLRSRITAAGEKSSLPARTLYRIQRAITDDDGAFGTLEAAIELRPADGELLLFAAMEWAGAGQREKARDLLAQAKPHSRRSVWLRAAARLAALEGDFPEEKQFWMEIAASEPLAMDVQAELARMASEESGPRAAFDHWESLRSQYPHHLDIAIRTASAALAIGERFAEPYLRGCIALSPAIVSSRLDLVHIFMAGGLLEDAERQILELESLNPFLAAVWYWKGRLHQENGRSIEAQSAYRQAIQLSVDIDGAANQLWQLAHGSQAHLELLGFLELELKRQTFGDYGFGLWFNLAASTLDADDVKARLREFRIARETSWIVWQCSVHHALNQGITGEALSLVDTMISRFSLIPGTWVEAGYAQRRAGRFDLAETSLRQAIHLNPFHTQGWIQLGFTLEAAGRRKDALDALSQALTRLPSDAGLHWFASNVLARDGQYEAALAAIEKSVSLDPTESSAWEDLGKLCRVMKKPTHWRDFASSLSESRPGNVEIAIEAARAAKECGNLEKALALVDHALTLRPRHIRAYLLKSEIFVSQRLWDDAIKVCEAPAWGEAVPAVLLGQASVILFQRGDQAEAIQKLRRAVKQDAAYAWGWERLAEMNVACNRPRDALNAAQHAAELQPNRGYAWHYWAEIHHQLSNHGEYLRLLKEAVLRDPAYGQAFITLIGQLLQNGKPDEAESYVTRTIGAVSKAHQLAAQALIAASRKQKVQARSLLEELCCTPQLERSLLESLANITKARFYENYLSPILYKQISRQGIQPAAVIYWIERCFQGKTFDLNTKLLAIPDEAVRSECLAYYLDRLGDLGQNDIALPLLRNHAPLFQTNDQLWASLGICLAVWRPVDTWGFLKNWREKSALSPHMLRTVALTALAVGELTEAAEISRTALAMDIRDSSYGFHCIVMALHHALENRMDLAKEALASGEPALDTNWNKALGELVSYAVSAKELNPKDARTLWTGARARMAAANKLSYQLMPRIATSIENALLDRKRSAQPWLPSDDPPDKPQLLKWGMVSTVILIFIAGYFSDVSSNTDGLNGPGEAGTAFIMLLPAAFTGAIFALLEIKRTSGRRRFAYALLAANILIPILWYLNISKS